MDETNEYIIAGFISFKWGKLWITYIFLTHGPRSPKKSDEIERES